MKNKSNCMLVSSIYSTLYIIIIGSMVAILESGVTNMMERLMMDTLYEEMGLHLGLLFIGTIFAYIATFTNKSGLALTGAILFSVSLIFMPTYLWNPLYFAPLIFTIVTAYIGWRNIKKIKSGYGKPFTGKNIALLVTALVIVALWFFLMMPSSSSDSSTSTATSEDTTDVYSNNSKVSQKEFYTINEPAIYEGMKLTVDKVQTSKGTEWNSLKEGMHYIIVTLTFENIGDEQISYHPWDFEMSNSSGVLSSDSYTSINSDTRLSGGKLLPGGKVTGTLSFEQPINDPALVLHYTTSTFSDSVELAFKLN